MYEYAEGRDIVTAWHGMWMKSMLSRCGLLTWFAMLMNAPVRFGEKYA
jgi:hypothetical protein